MSKQNDSNPTDEQSRQIIVDELDSNILVEAAAGTGKTTSMVERMLNLIVSGSCAPSQLSAVTFTRKAAAELRERFYYRLQTAADRIDDPVALERVQNAANQIESCFIGTFHSFCSMLLRERPIEFDVDPAFGDLDEVESMQIRENAWQTFLADLNAREDSRLDRIQELGLETSHLKSCYDNFCNYLDVNDWPHDDPGEYNLDGLKAETREYVEHIRQLIPSFVKDRGTDEMMDWYESIVRAADHLDWNVLGQFFELLEYFDKSSLKTTQKCWHEKSVAKEEKGRYANFREHSVNPAMQWWYTVRYRFLIELMIAATDIYNRMREASGGLDFQDLLLKVAEGLEKKQLLRQYFSERFTHLLVDEFQDTDPLQAKILALLTSDDELENDWRKCRPRPGSLFLVGDPKQSIYRFRRADIVTYQQMKELFRADGNRIVKLSRNFRSTSPVRDWINDQFRDMFPPEENSFSPVYVPLQPGHPKDAPADLSGVVKLTIPEDLYASEVVPYEANQLAKFISQAIQTGMTVSRTPQELERGRSPVVEPGDFMILARTKRDLGVYASALDQTGIANEVVGANSFGQHPELGAVLDLLRMLDDPGNPVPYVAVLRGPCFGFSDVDLFEIRQALGAFTFTRPVPENDQSPVIKRLAETHSRFQRYQKWLRKFSFPVAILKMVEDLGILARSCVPEDGSVIAGGLLKAIEWLRSESWNFDSTRDLVSYLEQMIESSESDSCSLLPVTGTSVRIMNLHKAKGLEAPIVFLAGNSGGGEHTPQLHIDRENEEPSGFLAITVSKNSYGARKQIAVPPDWESKQEIESTFEREEQTRLLYVACTRAASMLVVTVSRRARNSSWRPLFDHLDTAPELSNLGAGRQLQLPLDGSGPASDVGQTEDLINARKAAFEEIDQRWRAVQKSSYQIVAAKESAVETQSRPQWRTTGEYGAQWGSAIHRLFELRIRFPQQDLLGIATELVNEFDLGVDRVTEMMQTVDRLHQNEIWQRVKSAADVYTEIPFEFCDGDPSPIITRGVIDLCFREANGWVIVDYKTDDIERTDLPQAVKHHRAQVLAYAAFWEKITGETVAESGLYFTKHDCYVTLEASG